MRDQKVEELGLEVQEPSRVYVEGIFRNASRISDIWTPLNSKSELRALTGALL